MTNDQLLAEIEDVLRAAPSIDSIHSEKAEVYPWEGRVAAVIHKWDFTCRMSQTLWR